MGYRNVQYLGSIEEVHVDMMQSGYFPSDIRTFMQELYSMEVYHAYAVQSTEMLTMEDMYFAVDWYWQEPCDIQGDSWYYWILTDIHNPDQWYRAEYPMVRGIRQGEVMGLAHRSHRVSTAVFGGFSDLLTVEATFAVPSTGTGPSRMLAWVCFP